MLNTAFIQSNLPNLQTQEQLLRDRFEKETNLNFELVPRTEQKEIPLKYRATYGLENREYNLEELNNTYLELIDMLVEGITKEGKLRNARTVKYSYPLECMSLSLEKPTGYILLVPKKTNVSEIPYLMIILNVTFME